MEIHPPHPVHSLKDFFIQLLTITAGILIALALDGVVEWRHHRQLAHEAESNLGMEIRENGERLERYLGDLAQMQKGLQNILAAADQMKSGHSVSSGALGLTIPIITLRTAAWNTAEGIGALSYMKFAAVQRYAQVYGLQQQFDTLQQRTLDTLLELESYSFLLNKNPKGISAALADDAERTLSKALAAVQRTQDVGRKLAALYR